MAPKCDNNTCDTRDLIMEHAAALLLTRGFNGFSYKDISIPLGVKNAAIHYHFPTKADLAIALIESYHHTLRENTSEFMTNGGPARPQLEGLFMFTASQFRKGRYICPMGAFSVDFDDLPYEVKTANEYFMQASIQWLTKVLEVGREQNEFQFAGSSEQRAMTLLAALQGARQMARVHGESALTNVIQQLRIELGIPEESP